MSSAGASRMPLVSDSPSVRVYVWDVVVRVCHWAVAFSILILALTGVYMGSPYLVVTGEAGQRFAMGTAKIIHFYAAIAFTLAVLTRVLWMFVGRRRAGWRELVPVDAERRRGVLPTVAFYLWARPLPPPAPGHNPLAGLTYIAVFALYFVMITTGLGLYGLAAHVGSPMHTFGFLAELWGGAQSARFIHHVVMWLLVGFFVHHVMSALLMSQVEANGTMDSIFSGYKWLPPEEAAREAERWAPRGR